jgi:hypothetical protein
MDELLLIDVAIYATPFMIMIVLVGHVAVENPVPLTEATAAPLVFTVPEPATTPSLPPKYMPPVPVVVPGPANEMSAIPPSG